MLKIKPFINLNRDYDNFIFGVMFTKENHHKYWIRKGKEYKIYFGIAFVYWTLTFGIEINQEKDD